tara:strand:- start:377 stop:1126 length:750 start_codon:yes stop_codon:yes gene_type:complete
LKKIIVLIPFYNESNNFKVIENLIQTLDHENMKFKFIFCNDNSSDDTQFLIKNFLISKAFDFEILVNNSNLGHGGSLIRLSQHKEINEYDFVLTLDFDFCYLIKDLSTFFEMSSDDTILIGRRKAFDEGFFRQFITSVSESLIYLKTFLIFNDTNCPIRLYPSSIFLKIWKNIPIGTLIPNIFSTYLILKNSYSFERIYLNKNNTMQLESTTWGNNFFLKKFKILKFSFNSLRQLLFFKIDKVNSKFQS